MFSRTRGVATLALALALPMAACDGGTDAEFGSITLQLTDAPGDVAHAWVTIESIYLQPGDENGEVERVMLMEDAESVDLMTLSNDIEGLVDDVEVPAGFYRQLRMVVSDACILVETDTDGEFVEYTSDTEYDACATDPNFEGAIVAGGGTFHGPSWDQSGIKVLLNGSEGLDVTGGQHIYLLDFDVSESFGREAGSSARWVAHPVIKASEIELTSSVTVSVTADEELVMPEVDGETLTLGDLVADLSTEEGDVALTDDDGDGTYTATFGAIVPDLAAVYVVSIEGEGLNVVTDPVDVEVELASGQDIQASFVVTEVTVDDGSL